MCSGLIGPTNGRARFFSSGTAGVGATALEEATVGMERTGSADIDSGIDINSTDEKGRSILFSLVAKKKIDSIKILIEKGIDLT